MRFGKIFVGNLCYKCVYNIPNKWDHTMERSTCSKFDGRYADLCRFDENKCGLEGRHFKDKKDHDPLETPQTKG